MNKKQTRLAAAAAALAAETLAPEVETGGGTADVPTTTATTVAEVPKRTDEETKAWIAERVSKLSEALQVAIAEGDVVPSIREVEISEKSSPTKVRATREYLGLDAMSGKGMGVMNGGRIKPAKPRPGKGQEDTRTPEEKLFGACDWHNYGYDLDVRQEVRGQLLATLEGPEKAIASAVKGLRAIYDNDEEVRAQIVNSPKFASHPNIDALVTAALAGK